MVFNPDMAALEESQAAAGANINKTIITIPEFRMAMSYALDRANFCLATSPTNSAAFGLFSNTIISDPEAGISYRSTIEAKNALANFWGVSEDYGEGKMYADIDEAIASITGYNLAMAQEKFSEASLSASAYLPSRTSCLTLSRDAFPLPLNLSIGYPDHRVSSFRQSVSLSVPPKIIAPFDPFPIGYASSQNTAGFLSVSLRESADLIIFSIFVQSPFTMCIITLTSMKL
jgi:hypothetical protein